MMRSLLLVLLAIPALATAKSPQWFLEGADEAAISAPVELTLYRSEDTDWVPAVFVAFPAARGDEEGRVVHHLAKLSLEGRNEIPEALAGDLRLKVGEAYDIKYAVIPQLQLGDATLNGVRVEVGSDLVLNLNTLDELAFAILPSSGMVRIAPASGAEELLGAVGAPIQGTVESEKPWFFHGKKIEPRPGDLVVEGSLLGQEGLLKLALDRWSSAVGGEAELPEDAVIREGERYVRTVATLGGLALPEVWYHHEQDLVAPEGNLLGVLGYDVLYGLDLAFDPTTDRIALAGAAQVQAADPSERLLEIAREDFARAEEKAAGEEKEEGAEEDDGSKGDAAAVSRHTALGEALWSHGSRSEALEHYAAAAEAAGERCGPILTHGRRLAEMGSHEQALVPLRTAGELWDRWWAQDRELRKSVEKDRQVEEGTFTIEQSSSCHEAWGELASSHFA
ncbi:MAG: hypothetical protein JRI25_16800, partial [Deltaproteobacteria bacterium]|nr:hypothetical protein [Deltaproteobacteria bacterium]